MSTDSNLPGVMGSNNVIPVLTSSTPLLAYDSKRLRVTYRNMDPTNPVYMSYSNPATTATGFPLLAGESITISVNKPMWAIATGGTVSVPYITEENVDDFNE